ncbi:MAG: HAD family hydrolase [Candidatus Helarchaeota archaeon]
MRNKYFAITITKEQAYFTEEILRDTFAKMNIKLNPQDFVKCCRLYHSYEIQAWKPYPKTQQILKTLAKDYKLALLTNASQLVAESILKLHAMDKYFTFIFTDIRKPRLSAFHMFKDAMQVDFPELCMVGDDIKADIEPAIQLGMKTIHTYRGYEYLKHHAILKIQPHKKVNKLEEVVTAIKDLSKL